jgi:hypothetical protein
MSWIRNTVFKSEYFIWMMLTKSNVRYYSVPQGPAVAGAATQVLMEQMDKMSLFDGKAAAAEGEEAAGDIGTALLKETGEEKDAKDVNQKCELIECPANDLSEQDGQWPPINESMYMSAIDHHTEAERQEDSISDRFCCGDIEEEEEDGAGEPQWTWVSAGACFLDAERLPPSWFVQTNNRAEPEVLCILSSHHSNVRVLFRIPSDLPLPDTHWHYGFGSGLHKVGTNSFSTLILIHYGTFHKCFCTGTYVNMF